LKLAGIPKELFKMRRLLSFELSLFVGNDAKHSDQEIAMIKSNKAVKNRLFKF